MDDRRRPRKNHRDRYRQIAAVLGRHGLGYLAGTLGLERFIPFHRGLLGHRRRDEPYTRPEHVRLALEELGTTFIKLGQVLSTRADLISPALQAELAKLQDQVPAIPFDAIREALEAELGLSVDEAFAAFQTTPIAAASIGQAYAATLLDGTEVVVKVRRPGAVEQVEEDLEILQNLAATASRRWEAADQYDLVGLAQEFAQTLRAELDYLREGRSAERFAANFADDPNVHIPRVLWDTTTSRVLTLERIHGTKINDLAGLDNAGIDRSALAIRSANILLKMVFDDGYFHADPHPGNFFIEASGRIGLIDFGMVGTVDDRSRDQLAELVMAIASRDADRLVDAFLELGAARGRVDRPALRQDLDHLVALYVGRPLGEIAVGEVLEQALTIVRRHRLRLPSDLALLLKTLIMSEGLAAQLDPSFRMTTVLAPFAEKLMWRQYSPLRWGRQFAEAGLEAARLGVEMPRQIRWLLADLQRGGLEIGARPVGVEPLLRHAERLVNRIALAIIAAAFISGLGMLMAVYHPVGWEGWMGAFFAFGFIVATILGLYLAWSILRAGRR